MKSRSGRLLIVGGQKNEFSLVQAIYQGAESAGIGECLAVMPDTLRRLIGETGFARFAPASQSGSLGKAAQGAILELARDCDGLVIGGNLTNNSETAVMIESLMRNLDMPVVVTEEAVEVLKFDPTLITGNPNALVVVTMGGLFALANHHNMPIAIRRGGGVLSKIELLRQLMSISRSKFVIFGNEILIGVADEVSLTPLQPGLPKFPGLIIGAVATLWLQNLAKPFIGLTSAAYVLSQAQGPTSPELTSSINATLAALEKQ